jgi:hypothetical protein
MSHISLLTGINYYLPAYVSLHKKDTPDHSPVARQVLLEDTKDPPDTGTSSGELLLKQA